MSEAGFPLRRARGNRLQVWVSIAKTAMKDNPVARYIIDIFRFYGLLLRYCWLRLVYVYLLVKHFFIKTGGAALIEAVEIWYSIKTMSNQNRIIFAACIAVSIYGLALITLIRL